MADSTPNTPGSHPGVSTRTRREAFTALGFTGLAAIAVAGFARPEPNLIAGDQISPRRDPSPARDAHLLTLCTKMDALERLYRWTVESNPDCDCSLTEPISDEQSPIVDEIAAIRATSVEGIRAKAASLLLWAPDLVKADDSPDPVELLTWSILRDLTAEVQS